MRLRLAVIFAVLVAAGSSVLAEDAPAPAAPPAGSGNPPPEAGFRFIAAEGQTMSWLVTEEESASLGGRYATSVRWSEHLTLTFDRDLGEGFEAKLTVSSVKPEPSSPLPDTLHFALAKAIEDKPLDVLVDRSGFIARVRNWPGVRGEMSARIASTSDPESVRLIGFLLDKLDDASAGNVVGRPLLLLSAAFSVPFRIDGSAAEYPDWQGGAAYMFPGRTIKTKILGKQDTKVAATWTFSTDPRNAADHIGNEVLSLLNAAARDQPMLRDVARTAASLLAAAGLELDEDGVVIYDASVRRIVSFQHRVRILVGEFNKEQKLVVTALN
ncbi:MAG TPA: hypothetical protein VFB16_12915 [Bauldia sp.]|nr:hypothetical protein [Bauldia sp.]